jgi:hypothetical protein
MLKTKTGSTPKKGGSRAKPARSSKKSNQLAPEQQARLIAFQKFVKEQQDAWNALSPAQQREEEESWKRIMNRMNEDRKGFRQLFVDP